MSVMMIMMMMMMKRGISLSNHASYNLAYSQKNLFHKGVDFYVQNALKLAYEHL